MTVKGKGFSDAAWGTTTESLTPSKERAPLTRPVILVGELRSVPPLPVPEESRASVPLASSNIQNPTSPVSRSGAALLMVTATGSDVAELPAASRATEVRV